MKGLNTFRLLWVTRILTSLLCGAQNTTGIFNQTIQEANSTAEHVTASADLWSDVTSELTPHATSTAELSTKPSTSVKPAWTRTNHYDVPTSVLYKQQCLPLLMISGGLILATVILFMSTLLLTWKVCQLSSRIKTLSSNADLISNCEYWMGSAQRQKRGMGTEAKEHVLLLEQVNLTQEEVSNNVTTEEHVPKAEQQTDEKKESDEASTARDEKNNIVRETEKVDTKLPEGATSLASASEGDKDVV